MGFWDSATRGFEKGVPLGVRSAERAEEREMRAEERAENKRRWDIQDKRDAERFDRETKKYNEDEDYKRLSKKVQAIQLLYESGDEPTALAQAQNTYNNYFPDARKGKFYRRQDIGDDNPLAKKWDSDTILKGNNIVFVSQDEEGKAGGVRPFKSGKEVIDFLRDFVRRPEAFFAARDQANLKVSELNATEKPFKGQDGHDYVQTWEVGPGGKIQKGPVRAYTDVMRESEGQKKVREAETILGGKVSKSDRRVLAGLAAPESAEERVKKAGLGRGEDALKISKALAELSEKERNIFKKDMDFVLRPFASKGTELFDEDGEMTPAANTALDEALQLIDKADAGKDLTPAEKKKLTHARRAWDMYNKISGKVAAGYEGKKTGGAGMNWRDYSGVGISKGKGALRKKISIPKA